MNPSANTMPSSGPVVAEKAVSIIRDRAEALKRRWSGVRDHNAVSEEAAMAVTNTKESTTTAAAASTTEDTTKTFKARKLMPLPKGFEPRPNDVICARGKDAWNHNQHYRDLVNQHLQGYSQAEGRLERTAIIVQVMDAVKEAGGEFVRYNKEDGLWYIVEHKTTREKTGFEFREKLHTRYKSANKAKRRRRKEPQPLPQELEQQGQQQQQQEQPNVVQQPTQQPHQANTIQQPSPRQPQPNVVQQPPQPTQQATIVHNNNNVQHSPVLPARPPGVGRTVQPTLSPEQQVLFRAARQDSLPQGKWHPEEGPRRLAFEGKRHQQLVQEPLAQGQWHPEWERPNRHAFHEKQAQEMAKRLYQESLAQGNCAEEVLRRQACQAQALEHAKEWQQRTMPPKQHHQWLVQQQQQQQPHQAQHYPNIPTQRMSEEVVHPATLYDSQQAHPDKLDAYSKQWQGQVPVISKVHSSAPYAPYDLQQHPVPAQNFQPQQQHQAPPSRNAPGQNFQPQQQHQQPQAPPSRNVPGQNFQPQQQHQQPQAPPSRNVPGQNFQPQQQHQQPQAPPTRNVPGQNFQPQQHQQPQAPPPCRNVPAHLFQPQQHQQQPQAPPCRNVPAQNFQPQQHHQQPQAPPSRNVPGQNFQPQQHQQPQVPPSRNVPGQNFQPQQQQHQQPQAPPIRNVPGQNFQPQQQHQQPQAPPSRNVVDLCSDDDPAIPEHDNSNQQPEQVTQQPVQDIQHQPKSTISPQAPSIPPWLLQASLSNATASCAPIPPGVFVSIDGAETAAGECHDNEDRLAGNSSSPANDPPGARMAEEYSDEEEDDEDE